jgi:hypothetical protein
MKTVMSNYKKMTLALATFVALGFSNASFAGKSSEGPAILKFVGKVQNLPVFQLCLNNSENSPYVVIVKDADGNVLFKEKLKGEKISRAYELDTDDAEKIGGTTFEVTNLKTNGTSVYKIKSNVTIVNDVEIAKL